MILNSTKFGGNWTKDVEVGPDRWTDGQPDRPIPIYPPPQTMFAGGIKRQNSTWDIQISEIEKKQINTNKSRKIT